MKCLTHQHYRKYAILDMITKKLMTIESFKWLLHCFSTCVEITGDDCYCFIFKNIENCKEKFQRVNKLLEI